MKYFVETYDSVEQMLRLFDRPENAAFAGRSLQAKEDGSASWMGTETYAEAVNLIRNGWEEPLKELKEAIKSVGIKANTSTEKLKPRAGVVGYAPHVPNAIRGIPESMIGTERVPQKVKAVTIIYSSDANAGLGQEDFFKSGAVVLKIINDLELKGYRVRLLHEFCAARKGSESILGRVTLKDWRQPIDLKKLTFPLANAAMIRRFGFRFTETIPGIKEGWAGGYGGALNSLLSYKEVCDELRKNKLLNENEYFINIKLVRECKHDSEKVVQAAGMVLN
jgi:hypothetical protein